MTPQEEITIHNTYGEHCYFSHGTNFARGVCTIIPKDVNFRLLKTEKDTEGRYIIVNGIFNGIELTIVNIYAPTQDKVKEQQEFYKNILNIIQNYTGIVWTGDYNLYLDPILDQFTDNKIQNSNADMIADYMDENNLVDI
jgi:exonuclease III